MLHHKDGARFLPDVTLGIQAKEFNLGFIRSENLVSHGLRSFRCHLSNSQVGFHVPFTEECLLSGHNGLMVESCRDGCSSGRFFHLHRGTLELCQSDHRLLGHLPDQGTFAPIAQFGQAASSRKSLGGSKLLPFKNGGHFVLKCVGTLLQFCAS